MTTVENRLEALALVESWHHGDSGLASAIWFRTDDREGLLAALTSLAGHLARALHGDDLDSFVDYLRRDQIETAVGEVPW